MELRLYLIEYAPGVAAPPHVHPVEGIGYVVEGAFESAFSDEAPSLKQQGESFVDRASVEHRIFRNASSSAPLRFVMAYAVRKDAPVLLPVAPGARSEAASNPNDAPSTRDDGAAGAATALAAGPAGIHRTAIGIRAIDGLPGWELRVLLVEYDPGVAAQVHTHPVPGVGYVLEGTFESAWGEGGDVAVKHQGEPFVDRAHERHLFRNASSTEPLRFLVAYAIPKGAPTLVPV